MGQGAMCSLQWLCAKRKDTDKQDVCSRPYEAASLEKASCSTILLPNSCWSQSPSANMPGMQVTKQSRPFSVNKGVHGAQTVYET